MKVNANEMSCKNLWRCDEKLCIKYLDRVQKHIANNMNMYLLDILFIGVVATTMNTFIITSSSQPPLSWRPQFSFLLLCVLRVRINIFITRDGIAGCELISTVKKKKQLL